jgi:PAP2 superfamily
MFVRYRLGYQILLAIALLEIVAASSFGMAAIRDYLPGGDFFGKMLLVWVLIPVAWAGFVWFEIARRRSARPLIAFRRTLYHRRHWLARGGVFMVVILYFVIAFTSFKTAIPHLVPFYADPWLGELDRAAFGTDAWRLTHGVIGDFGTLVIDRVYVLWFAIMMFYVGWFCFTRNQLLQVRGLLTFVIAWTVLGSILALGLSSVGPCFYETFYGDRQFAPLMDHLHEVHSEHTLFAILSMDYLIASIGNEQFAMGISAMPSLHVAIAYLCFLVAREYAQHFLPKLLAGLFAAFIFVGSVHLGWHYVSDGLVGIVGVSLIWWGTGRFSVWLEQRETERDSLPAAQVEPVPAVA